MICEVYATNYFTAYWILAHGMEVFRPECIEFVEIEHSANPINWIDNRIIKDYIKL
jgi:hypothetical protein